MVAHVDAVRPRCNGLFDLLGCSASEDPLIPLESTANEVLHSEASDGLAECLAAVGNEHLREEVCNRVGGGGARQDDPA